MIKFISSKEYTKLTKDVDYWNSQALEQEHLHNFYEGKARSLLKENKALKQKNEDLEEEKRSKNFYETMYKEEKSWHKFYKEEHAKKVNEYMYLKQKYDELKEQNEHHCNKSCFKKHILPAIQSDYDKHSDFQKSDLMYQVKFFSHWENKLKEEYDFVFSIYKVKDTIFCQFK